MTLDAKRQETLHPIARPTLPEPEEVWDGFREILQSGKVTCGNQVTALEDDFHALTGVHEVVGVSSGTSALMLLIRAMRLPVGSEVIVPSFTFAATAQALLWNGLVPVFCDCDPDSFTMDVSAAEYLVSDRTSGILPVCIFGVPGDLDAYQELADRRSLALIYDSAQGLGSTYKGLHLGHFGMGEAFSLSPTKVVTAMEGGLLATNDPNLADTLRAMRDYGKGPDGQDMHWLGLSARMSEINALIARWSLSRVDQWIARRSEIVARYRERLEGLEGITFQKIPPNCASSLNYLVMVVDPVRSGTTREELYYSLGEYGIQTKRYFFPALHNQKIFRHIDPGCYLRMSVTERISATSLALPLYSHMPMDVADLVCDRISEHITDNRKTRAARAA